MLKEPQGYYHIHFLFMMSVRHKDNASNDYGWRINLFLHIYILHQLEKLLGGRLNSYADLQYGIDYLYQLVTQHANFYEQFVKAY